MDSQDTAETNGRLTSAQMLADRRRDVKTSRGIVTIRKLSLREIFALKGGVIDLAAMATTEAEAERIVQDKGKHNQGAVMQAIYGIIGAGVIDPKLCNDPAQGPTADDFDFPDAMSICHSIMDFSGYSKGAAESLRPS